VSPFRYLLGRTARNWVRLQLGRLRRVRYLVAVLAGALYFWAIFFRHVGMGGGSAEPVDPRFLAFASLFVALPISFWWLAKADPRALAFSPAEMQLLFPAPLTRRALILYKIGRGQLPVLLNVVIFTLIFLRDGPPEIAVQRAVGFWILFTTLFLHRLGAALTRLGATSRAGLLTRRVGPALVIGAALAAVALSLQRAAPRAMSAGLEGAVPILIEALGTGPAGVVLAPFRALMAPAFTPEPLAWLGTIGVALLILLAHLVWVLRADAAFEEAAAAAAAREAERSRELAREIPPRRSRWRIPRLPLTPTGPPERAILWKNSVPLLDGINLVLLVSAGVLLLIAAFLIADRLPGPATPGLVLTLMALVVTAAATVLGPVALRDDLRGDLPRLDLLRSYPLDGERIVTMEVLSVAIPVAILQIGFLLVALLASLGVEAIEMSLGTRVAIVLAAGGFLPFVALAGTWVQNAVVLLFPDWVPLGRQRGGGVESTGQGMLLLGATLIVTLVLLLAPLVLAAVVALVAAPLGVWALLPASAVGALVLGLEIRVLLRWLGGVFDRTDPVEAGIAR
jgi:ABC-2 type transport system permease protein